MTCKCFSSLWFDLILLTFSFKEQKLLILMNFSLAICVLWTVLLIANLRNLFLHPPPWFCPCVLYRWSWGREVGSPGVEWRYGEKRHTTVCVCVCNWITIKKKKRKKKKSFPNLKFIKIVSNVFIEKLYSFTFYI